jgi:hypothetical protein
VQPFSETLEESFCGRHLSEAFEGLFEEKNKAYVICQ